MILEDEDDLRYTYKSIVRMFDLIDSIAADTTGNPEGRECEIASVRSMIRKLERQIAAYYATYPERIANQTPNWEIEALREAEAAREAQEAQEPEPVT